MFYTHRYNLLATFAASALALAAGAAVAAQFPHEPERLCAFLLVGAAVLIPAMMLAYPTANRLFLAHERDTQVTWAEARELSPLFQFSRRWDWYQAKELPRLAPHLRLAYLRRVLTEARESGEIAETSVLFGSASRREPRGTQASLS